MEVQIFVETSGQAPNTPVILRSLYYAGLIKAR